MNLNYKVNNDSRTVNQILKEEFKISARLMLKLVNNKKIEINGLPCDTRIKPKENDIIIIKLDTQEDNSNIKPTEMKLNIIYEDEYMLAVNKPAGIAVHPSMRHYSDSLSNGVKFYFDKINLKKKVRPVNRLDLGTSGVVVFAKNEYTQECLIRQMNEGNFKKEYICAVKGIFKDKVGTIAAPIARKDKSIIERCVRSDGQKAITHYEVIKESQDYSIVKCFLETGRTHQIRVHMAYMGHPILGDTLYGEKTNFISRQALHCYKLSCMHPIGKSNLALEAKIPDDIQNLIK